MHLRVAVTPIGERRVADLLKLADERRGPAALMETVT